MCNPIHPTQLDTYIHPANLPAGIVIGLSVRDPSRLQSKISPLSSEQLPQSHAIEDITSLITPSPDIALSNLWIESEREVVTESDKDIQTLQHSNGFPGAEVPGGPHIPAIVFQHSACTAAPAFHTLSMKPSIHLHQSHKQPSLVGNGFSGITVVVPRSTALAFWHRFVYSGARAIGLENRNQMLVEYGAPSFPSESPDCWSGLIHQRSESEFREMEYSKHPKGMRVNFERNGVKYPFILPWGELLGMSKEVQHSLGSTLAKYSSAPNFLVVYIFFSLSFACVQIFLLSKKIFLYNFGYDRRHSRSPRDG
jgi:hypothetical protein